MGGRLTLTLKYQFSLILESAGQKVFFACFHVFMFSFHIDMKLFHFYSMGISRVFYSKK